MVCVFWVVLLKTFRLWISPILSLRSDHPLMVYDVVLCSFVLGFGPLLNHNMVTKTVICAKLITFRITLCYLLTVAILYCGGVELRISLYSNSYVPPQIRNSPYHSTSLKKFKGQILVISDKQNRSLYYF